MTRHSRFDQGRNESVPLVPEVWQIDSGVSVRSSCIHWSTDRQFDASTPDKSTVVSLPSQLVNAPKRCFSSSDAG